MGIQQNAMSFSRQLREQVRSTLTNETGTADDESPHSEHGDADHVSSSFGNLFHCSRCGDVYIATETHLLGM